MLVGEPRRQRWWLVLKSVVARAQETAARIMLAGNLKGRLVKVQTKWEGEDGQIVRAGLD